MEIERLHNMLLEAGIEHEWRDRTPPHWSETVADCPALFENIKWGWQIIVYKENGERLVSAIEGYGSYGHSSGFDFDNPGVDLIEIMGLLTPEKENNGFCGVQGWLTAEEVFRRIKEAICGSK